MAALVTSASSILGSSLPTPLPSLSVTGISPPVSKISVAGPANSDVRRIVECDAVQTQVVTETLSLVQERMHHLMAKHDRELSDPASHTRRLLELFFGKDLTDEQLGFITGMYFSLSRGVAFSRERRRSLLVSLPSSKFLPQRLTRNSSLL